MTAEVQIQDHIKLIQKFAHQVYRRMDSAGNRTCQLSDVVQELCVAWCVARDKWRPEHGVPFIAFLVRGMRNHINRYAKNEIAELNGSHTDIDAPLNDETDSAELHDILASAEIGADEFVIATDIRAKVMRRMSPRARQFVELCENPPPALFKIVDAMRDRRQFAIDRGVAPSPTQKRITANLIFKVMGADRVESGRIIKELTKLAERR